MTATLPTSLLTLVDRQPLVLPGSTPAGQAIAQLRASRRNYLLACDGERIVGLLTACTALIWLDSEADLASIVALCPICGTTLPALLAFLCCSRPTGNSTGF